MVWRWSKTASSNSTADSTINWAEGQAPSSINDSARAEMARVAQWRDDISGTITTGGTSSAFTVTSNQVFDTLAHMDGAIIAFVPHTTSAGSCTLSVDGLAAKSIRMLTGVNMTDGVLVQGTPYVATYYNSVGEFLLHNLAGNPYNIPLGSGIDYWGTTPPNASFVFPYGQAISRSTYASLFSIFSTTYGSGDGSTTFNLPDKRGRVSAGLDNMGGTQASRLTGVTITPAGTVLGSVGGEQTHTLTTAELPVVTPAGTVSTPTISIGYGAGGTQAGSSSVSVASGGFAVVPGPVSQLAITATSSQPTFTGSSFGSGNAHTNIQPTIVCNYILRIY